MVQDALTKPGPGSRSDGRLRCAAAPSRSWSQLLADHAAYVLCRAHPSWSPPSGLPHLPRAHGAFVRCETRPPFAHRARVGTVSGPLCSRCSSDVAQCTFSPQSRRDCVLLLDARRAEWRGWGGGARALAPAGVASPGLPTKSSFHSALSPGRAVAPTPRVDGRGMVRGTAGARAACR